MYHSKMINNNVYYYKSITKHFSNNKISNPCIYFGSFSVNHFIEKLSVRILVGLIKAKINPKYIFKQQKMYRFKVIVTALRFQNIESVAFVPNDI